MTSIWMFWNWTVYKKFYSKQAYFRKSSSLFRHSSQFYRSTYILHFLSSFFFYSLARKTESSDGKLVIHNLTKQFQRSCTNMHPQYSTTLCKRTSPRGQGKNIRRNEQSRILTLTAGQPAKRVSAPEKWTITLIPASRGEKIFPLRSAARKSWKENSRNCRGQWIRAGTTSIGMPSRSCGSVS